jgi:hypothetical protein
LNSDQTKKNQEKENSNRQVNRKNKQREKDKDRKWTKIDKETNRKITDKCKK